MTSFRLQIFAGLKQWKFFNEEYFIFFNANDFYVIIFS